MTTDRIERAAAATRTLLLRLSLPEGPLVLLRDSHHVSFRAGDSIAVRVLLDGTGSDSPTREVDVARHLSANGGTGILPLDLDRAGPYELRQCVITLWHFEPAMQPPTVAEAAASLSSFHSAMRTYGGPLPGFRSLVSRAMAALDDRQRAPDMTDSANSVLCAARDRIRDRIARYRKNYQPIHGDSHMGNVIGTRRGAVWLDFEDVCLGPVEWDIAHLPPEAQSAFDFDSRLLCDMRMFSSLIVAIWCWRSYSSSQEKQDAAVHHTELLRRWLADGSGAT